LDHHFDDHTNFTGLWCKAVKMNDEGIKMSEEERSKKYGHTDDPKYSPFKEALASWFTEEALRQVHHSFNSQK
jgi:hypothetical protein